MKIKVKEIVKGCFPVIHKGKGDWIDLVLAEDVYLEAGQSKIVSLGVAMALPAGIEAMMKVRSSLTKNHNVTVTCSGVMDNSYRGNKDIWLVRLTASSTTHIEKGTRICQFRTFVSQFATTWQKLRWLFSSGITLQRVDDLKCESRGGFGSTGKK